MPKGKKRKQRKKSKTQTPKAKPAKTQSQPTPAKPLSLVIPGQPVVKMEMGHAMAEFIKQGLMESRRPANAVVGMGNYIHQQQVQAQKDFQAAKKPVVKKK